MPTLTPQDPKVQAVAEDALQAATIGQSIYSDMKKGGASAAMAELPGVIALGEKAVADVRAAMPAIKAGYKTTEFWMFAGVFLANGLYTSLTHGKMLPLDLNLVLTAGAAIYAFARSMVKSGATAAAATVAVK